MNRRLKCVPLLFLASTVIAFGQSPHSTSSPEAGSRAQAQENSSGPPSDSAAIPDNAQPGDSEN